MLKILIPLHPPSFWLVLLLRRGPKKGSKFCDLLETLKFLNMFRKKARNVYQLYHSNLHFDTKKIYRYLRYCLKTDLLEIDHIEENKFFPPKYYRLTQKGQDLIALFNSRQKTLAPKQH
jgi:predicted transcriptional regulator